MTEDPKDGEMSHMEFLRAQFFSSDADHAKHAAAIEAKRAAREKRRRRRASTAGIRALGRFTKAVEGMDQAERRASIGWLADKFLGIRLR